MNSWKRKYDENYAVYGSETDGAINTELVHRIDYVINSQDIDDDDFRYTADELRDLSEFYRICSNMSEKELAVAVACALDRFPKMVSKFMLNDYLITKGVK